MMKFKKLISAFAALTLCVSVSSGAVFAEDEKVKTGDYEINFETLEDLENAGVSAEKIEGGENVEIKIDKLSQYGLKDYSQENLFYLSHKGYVIIEVPENTVVDAFWGDFFRYAGDRCRVSVSPDKEEWTRIYASETEKKAEWSKKDKMSPVYKLTFSDLGTENRYRYIRIEFPRYGADDAIGKFGYHLTAYEDLPKTGERVIGYETQAELEAAGVEVVLTKVVGNEKDARVKIDDAAAVGMANYPQPKLFWFEAAEGYIILTAPDGTYFTDFWVDAFKLGESRCEVSISADKENYVALAKDEIVELAPFDPTPGRFFTPVKKLIFSNLGSENKYKYIRIDFTHGGDWYAAIGQLGYTWIDENTTEADLKKDEPKEEVITPEDFDKFTDVTKDFWGYESLKNLFLKGIIKGDGTKILPNNQITREQAASILVRTLGLSGGTPTEDETVSEWARAEFGTSVKHNIFSGDENGVLNGKNNMTREQAAVVLERAFKIESTPKRYADFDETSAWAKNSVGAMYAAGYLKGDEFGNVRPTDNITRAEFSAILDRILQDKEASAK